MVEKTPMPLFLFHLCEDVQIRWRCKYGVSFTVEGALKKRSCQIYGLWCRELKEGWIQSAHGVMSSSSSSLSGNLRRCTPKRPVAKMPRNRLRLWANKEQYPPESLNPSEIAMLWLHMKHVVGTCPLSWWGLPGKAFVTASAWARNIVHTGSQLRANSSWFRIIQEDVQWSYDSKDHNDILRSVCWHVCGVKHQSSFPCVWLWMM